MKSTIIDAKLGVGGKLFSSFSYNQNCSEVSNLVILLRYMCTCHIMVNEQRKVVIGANEMHYFKLKSVRNWYIPHFSLPFGIRTTLFNNFPTEVRDTYDPSIPEIPLYVLFRL